MHNRVFLCSFKKFEITFDDTQWRKVNSMQPMPLCLLWSECFEETFENSHRRKDKQMQPVPICISPSRKFEEAFVKQWREERQTLLHSFCGLQHAGWLFCLVTNSWTNGFAINHGGQWVFNHICYLQKYIHLIWHCLSVWLSVNDCQNKANTTTWEY